MDIKDLNKSQLILLVILITFVISIATSIMAVTLMQEAPVAIIQPITKVVKETIEKIVPIEPNKKSAMLSADQIQLLEQLKAIESLAVTIVIKGKPASADGSGVAEEDKIIGKGFIFGDSRIIITPALPDPKEGEKYIAKSILGEQNIAQLIQQKNYTIVELEKVPQPETILEGEPVIENDQSVTDGQQSTDGTETSPIIQ